MVEVEKKVSRYEKYKDSGVEWLGEIPNHWQIKPGFTILDESKEKNIGFVEETVLSLSYGNVIVKPKEKLTGLVPESFETYQLVKPGDIIIRPTDLQNDKSSLRTGLAKDHGIITSAYINLRVKEEYSNSFYHYYLHSIDINKVIYGLGSGLRQNISFWDFKRFPFPFPPLAEQTAIAQFLDDKTSKIEDAIAIKEQQISLLKERKQILIHKAVTRGLDDSVTLKDSGVEWIGEIPEHWKITYLKRYCLKVTDGSHHSPQTQYEGKSYISVKDVNAFGEIDTINCKKINQKDFNDLARNGCQPKKNDILLTKDGTIGRAAIVTSDNDFVVLSSLGIITPDLNEFNSNFLRYYLISPLCVSQMYSLIAGSALTRLTIEKINRLFVIIPPLLEQKEISAYIESASQKIETAIALKQQEIEKLKEYKSSLINGVVTGKVRVC